eukprot:5356653-Karenia_brevis.AAC.1
MSKIILTPWGDGSWEQFEIDMETLFDNAKFRKLQEISKIHDGLGGKVIIEVFQQSTTRVLVQKLHNIIAEEGLNVSATMNQPV